jgi:hypothetical protein
MNDPITAKDVSEKILEMSNDKVFVLDGSLSSKCTKALNELLAKPYSGVSQVAAENYNDSFKCSNWGKAVDIIEAGKEAGKKFGLFYAVDGNSATLADTIIVTEALSLMDDEQKKQSVVYIDNGDKPKLFASMVYQSAVDNSVDVYFDMDAATKALRKKVLA